MRINTRICAVLLIALFGVLLMAFSLIMIVRPMAFAAGIVRFSRARGFHLFEIVSRLLAGVAFICLADETLHPMLIRIMGWVLFAVGVGLALTPPAIHRHFAVWSADRFGKLFRTAGVVSLAFGAFIVHTAVSAPL